MSITDIGREGEVLSRHILLKWFQADSIFQADWMVCKNEKYYVIEVKHKEMFKAPPFDGHGLDNRQVNARMEFYDRTGIRCLFLVIDKETKQVYWQWLDVLEQGNKFTTRNNVVVYDIQGFNKTEHKIKQVGLFGEEL